MVRAKMSRRIPQAFTARIPLMRRRLVRNVASFAGMLLLLVAGCDRAEETWYHASDVAKLSTTERPQLVEFFHPD